MANNFDDVTGSYHTIPRGSLDYAEEHDIICLAFPSHATDKLQPLAVGVFQPDKKYHKDAVDEAIQMGDEYFNKVEFLRQAVLT